MTSKTTSIGIDPGSDYIGLGAVQIDDDNRLTCLGLHRIRVAGLSLGNFVAKVDQLLRPLVQGNVILSYEQPPPTARADTRHGHQAPIGWRLGVISGAIISPYLLADNVQSQEIKVAAWRDGLMDFAAVHGPQAVRPSRRDLGRAVTGVKAGTLMTPLTSLPTGGWIGEYTCGCEASLKTLKDVQESAICRNCSTVKKIDDPAIAIRDAWKELACQIVQHHFPQQYAELIEPARKAARSNPPDHQLSGVADACEGLCLSIGVLGDRISILRKAS